MNPILVKLFSVICCRECRYNQYSREKRNSQARSASNKTIETVPSLLRSSGYVIKNPPPIFKTGSGLISNAACRLVPKTKNIVIIFAIRENSTLLGAVLNSTVLTTQTLDVLPDVAAIEEFRQYVTNRFGEVSKIVFVSEKGTKLGKILKKSGFDVEKIDLDPMIGVCKKKHLHGPDSEILNIKV